MGHFFVVVGCGSNFFEIFLEMVQASMAGNKVQVGVVCCCCEEGRGSRKDLDKDTVGEGGQRGIWGLIR